MDRRTRNRIKEHKPHGMFFMNRKMQWHGVNHWLWRCGCGWSGWLQIKEEQ